PIGELELGEETLNLNSWYLGGLLGPIRAIRYVRGAKSGVNTIHHDVVYRNFWMRRINLRVHPLAEFKFYFDWRSTNQAMLYSSREREGLPIDGHQDPGVDPAFEPWTVVNSPDGGFGVVYFLPESPLFDEARFFYTDDASFDDAPPTNPNYGDEDDAAYGDHGLWAVDVNGSNVDPIPLSIRVYPVCIDEGSATLGDALQELAQNPIEVDPTMQDISQNAVRSLNAERDEDDVVLSWDSVALADFYRVYVSAWADLAPESWQVLGEPVEPTFCDAEAALAAEACFYNVVIVGPDGSEGGW
ncbi:MAG: hypothetical protein JSV80_03310, partial [Acidobacteriota bacterium]